MLGEIATPIRQGIKREPQQVSTDLLRKKGSKDCRDYFNPTMS